MRALRGMPWRAARAKGYASLPTAPVCWPALEVRHREDDQFHSFDAVHDGEREAPGEDAPRAQFPR